LTVVDAAGDTVEIGPGLFEMLRQNNQRLRLQIRSRLNPEPMHLFGRGWTG
jgi:hypothetical protein